MCQFVALFMSEQDVFRNFVESSFFGSTHVLKSRENESKTTNYVPKLYNVDTSNTTWNINRSHPLSGSERLQKHLSSETNNSSRSSSHRKHVMNEGKIQQRLDQWKTKYPECGTFSNKRFSFKRVVKFVKSTRTARYNHLSCFIMKSRYNCARKDNQHPAVKWKIVLRPRKRARKRLNQSRSESICDPSAVIEDIQGPIGIAAAPAK